ncbi:hypothetical protein ACROYT_G030251 [Oculina patagonica]
MSVSLKLSLRISSAKENVMFSNRKYPDSLVNSTITHFVNSMMSQDTRSTPQTENIYRIVLPFKDQKSADIVKKHLSDLSNKLDHKLQPVFRSRKVGDDLKLQESKPPVINQQCVVYNYVCDLCDAEYVGYTSRHLYKRIEKHRFSAIGKHLQNEHRIDKVGDLTNNLKILKKSDVCVNYQTLSDAERKETYQSGSVTKCDDDLAGWYRFQGAAGTKMAISRPSGKKCDADFPGWLDGSHPAVSDGIVTKTVCFGQMCNNNKVRAIQVKNCGSYFIYKLGPPPSCKLRYCGSD